MQPVHEMPVVIKIIAQLLYDNNNLLIIIAYVWVCMVVIVLTTLKIPVTRVPACRAH